jgi:ribonuclease Z
MPKLIFLGTANAIPDENHENTHMAIVGKERLLLIDCVGHPTLRLARCGIDLVHELTDLILTHFHPDHVSGAPSLLMHTWLRGRKTPLHIYGLKHTLDRVRQIMEFYDWTDWPGMYPVHFHDVEAQEMAPVLDSSEFRVFASPVKHMMPGIGLRVEALETGRTLAYSSDTEPTQAVVRLAQDADILIHEATGATHGHSSAAQAGEIARAAGAKQLYLVHYVTSLPNLNTLVEGACRTFPGPVTLAQDFMQVEI